MKEDLKKEIENILKELGVKDPIVGIDVPAHINLGDYSSSVAMFYAKQFGKKPFELAEEIKNKLKVKSVLKIDVVSPGFINFFFDNEYFGNKIKEVLEKGSLFGQNNILSEQKIFIEHTQPNPFKEFHIGHLMNNTIGESIVRIVKANGAEVQTATYHGDVGLHVAKAVWAIHSGKNIKEAYAVGHKAYEENSKAKEEITEINKKIYEESDEVINEIYENGRKESLDYFESLYKILDSEFDYHFFESESGEVGKELVEENIGRVFEEGEEGAVIFRGENFLPKTHTRVFLNKDKLPTYEAKELGLAQIKRDFFSFDKSITVTANEQDSFFKVVEVATTEVLPDLKGKLKHLSHGLLKLPTGKMSSREGNIISAVSLIAQVKEKILEKMNSGPEQSEGNKDEALATTDEKNEVAEIVAIGAIKYSILRQAIGGDIIFDFDRSISFEGDSGPYLQYATVRANSILKKAKDFVKIYDKIPDGWQTTNLERLIERFESIVKRAGSEYAPHYIATYLIELSGEFNSFYASGKIIDEKDQNSPYKLAMTNAFMMVMKLGLDLLGIKVPGQM